MIPKRQRNRAATFLTIETLPGLEPAKEGDSPNPFYVALFSDSVKEASLILLLNEIRGSNPQSDSNEKIRADLAKIKTLSEIVDIENILVRNLMKQEEEHQDELPDASGYSSNEPDDVL